jgi:hypothetical protein
MTPTPQTEVQLLADICRFMGVSEALIAGQTEVTLLQNIITAQGQTPVQGTEVPLLIQWLSILSPGTLPEQTEVQLLTQILDAYGGVQTGWNEVPLLEDILAILLAADSPPVNTSPPVVSPTSGSVGTLFSCSTGTWSDFPQGYGYQWLQDGTPIGGATGNTYTAQAGDVGTQLSCEVTATNTFGPSTPQASNSTNPISASSYYLRPDGVSFYLRPDGVSRYVRP